MLLKLEVALQFAEKCMIFCVYPRAQAREGPDGLRFLLRPKVLSSQPRWIQTGCERFLVFTSGFIPSGFFWAAKKITTHQASGVRLKA